MTFVNKCDMKEQFNKMSGSEKNVLLDMALSMKTKYDKYWRDL